MPGTYRIELAKQSRAGCKNKECAEKGVKIQKGELRFGTLITINEHTSWTYKHWGCVTPAQIHNLQESTEGDIDMVDGYDELPPEYQEKVKFALANGHVPDEDWNGDIECNRPGMKGFRVKIKTPKKKKGKTGDEDTDAEQAKPKKKRGRAVRDEDEVETPAPKKARGRGKGKKAAVKEEEEVPGSENEVPEPKAKKAKGKKGAVKKDANDDEGAEEVEAEAPKPKPKRGKKKATPTDGEGSVPQKRSRKKKVTAEDE